MQICVKTLSFEDLANRNKIQSSKTDMGKYLYSTKNSRANVCLKYAIQCTSLILNKDIKNFFSDSREN